MHARFRRGAGHRRRVGRQRRRGGRCRPRASGAEPASRDIGEKPVSGCRRTLPPWPGSHGVTPRSRPYWTYGVERAADARGVVWPGPAGWRGRRPHRVRPLGIDASRPAAVRRRRRARRRPRRTTSAIQRRLGARQPPCIVGSSDAKPWPRGVAPRGRRWRELPSSSWLRLTIEASTSPAVAGRHPASTTPQTASSHVQRRTAGEEGEVIEDDLLAGLEQTRRTTRTRRATDRWRSGRSISTVCEQTGIVEVSTISAGVSAPVLAAASSMARGSPPSTRRGSRRRARGRRGRAAVAQGSLLEEIDGVLAEPAEANDGSPASSSGSREVVKHSQTRRVARRSATSRASLRRERARSCRGRAAGDARDGGLDAVAGAHAPARITPSVRATARRPLLSGLELGELDEGEITVSRPPNRRHDGRVESCRRRLGRRP